MVRALLDGRNTQTRRVVKPQPVYTGRCEYYEWNMGGQAGVIPLADMDNCSPYGIPGDRLWVRETWAMREDTEPGTPKAFHYLKYRATCMSPESPHDDMDWHSYQKQWRPSIFMPRWASRITLELTAVRVERVQEITEEDQCAEGITFEKCYGVLCDDWFPTKAFADLWDSINAERGYPWEANPFVWVLTFKRVVA